MCVCVCVCVWRVRTCARACVNTISKYCCVVFSFMCYVLSWNDEYVFILIISKCFVYCC